VQKWDVEQKYQGCVAGKLASSQNNRSLAFFIEALRTAASSLTFYSTSSTTTTDKIIRPKQQQQQQQQQHLQPNLFTTFMSNEA
jgi:hypothetical protein